MLSEKGKCHIIYNNYVQGMQKESLVFCGKMISTLMFHAPVHREIELASLSPKWPLSFL